MPHKPSRVRRFFDADSVQCDAGASLSSQRCSRAGALSRPAPLSPEELALFPSFQKRVEVSVGLIARPVESCARNRGHGGFLVPSLLPGRTLPPAFEWPF